MRRRFASFFILVGGAALALFFTSDANRALGGSAQPVMPLLGWGLLLVIFGIILLRGASPAPQESRRFRTLRKLTSGQKKGEDQTGDKQHSS
ncbi:MAG: hypothetical protein OEY93_08700 [Anaerolineae bacterium]|nr:hypothetical protein [Anaerolineae bacterium]